MSEDPARVGRTIFVANAHRDANGRFIVRADERLTAFMELESRLTPEDGGRIALRRNRAGIGNSS